MNGHWQDLLRPIQGIDLEDRFGIWSPRNDHFASIKFYHPDDLEANREQKEILEWPIKMPTQGYLDSVNPSASPSMLSAPDLGHRNWLFAFKNIDQWDWDSLLTEEEYLNHVMRTGNLLGIHWRKSQYASSWLDFKPLPPVIDQDKALYESIQRQKELEDGTPKNSKKL